MSRRKKKQGGKWLIAVLTILLIAVAAVLVWKQWEYSAGQAFYGSLRGA